jgi:hypothetical protein
MPYDAVFCLWKANLDLNGTAGHKGARGADNRLGHLADSVGFCTDYRRSTDGQVRCQVLSCDDWFVGEL